MDDNSAALATSVSTTVGAASPILPPGHPIVFAEDPADSSVGSGSEPVATLNADLSGLESAFDSACSRAVSPRRPSCSVSTAARASA